MTILSTLKILNDTRGEEIEHWLAEKRAAAAPYFYTSVDLRHSGLRLVPVDTNLYPAGFNNLSPAATSRAARFVAGFLTERYPAAKRIAVIPENHTRNLFYLENLSMLLSLFERAGVEVRLGSLVAAGPLTLQTRSGKTITQYPLVRRGDQLSLEDFMPDLIVINNDMTSGAPEILQGLAQPVIPPLSMGWWQRRKSVHFAAYQALMEDFAKTFGIDSWLLSANFYRCGMVDFKERAGLDCIAHGVESVLASLRQKYKRYGIEDEPYVYVKAESGTYGMGVMTARSPADVLELNKKERNKMQVIKEGARVSEVIIQEGIQTIDRVEGNPAEPLIYLIDGIPAGGIWRINENRDAFGNLNAAGMEFTGMCDESEDECGQWRTLENCHFRSFGIVAAIAALAAAREDYSTGKEGEGI
ncbi:MAG: glutamate--cysteine ligase [Pseudomonadota bacterium]|nr:glutamate--cysteine ligase [Pseudomonadota bacterium]MDE3037755.1 glutamate--cysteine ligase [Pseudomonadota bacterium]